MQAAVNILIDALSYGMVLFIISIGLSITLGLMRVINLAHGAFAMIGGYVASFLIISLGWSFAGALCAAVVTTVLVGIPLERLLFRRVYGSHEPLAQILLTVGLTFVVIGVANYVFGPTLKIIPLPGIISGPLDIGIRTLPAHRVFVIACGLIVALALWFLVERTSFGIRLRATVDHPGMSAALGVRTELIYATTFALSVGLAAFGGVVGAELLPVEPFYALRYMVTFLVVVSVGGSGSIAGALLGALLLGLTDTIGKYLAPSYGQIFFYAAVIAVVFVFPRGLMPGKAG